MADLQTAVLRLERKDGGGGDTPVFLLLEQLHPVLLGALSRESSRARRDGGRDGGGDDGASGGDGGGDGDDGASGDDDGASGDAEKETKASLNFHSIELFDRKRVDRLLKG